MCKVIAMEKKIHSTPHDKRGTQESRQSLRA